MRSPSSLLFLFSDSYVELCIISESECSKTLGTSSGIYFKDIISEETLKTATEDALNLTRVYIPFH